MDKTLAEHFQNLTTTINRNVEPQLTTLLQTRDLKLALGGVLGWGLITCLWWAFSSDSLWPVMWFSILVMIVGRMWYKVTESWKNGVVDYDDLETGSEISDSGEYRADVDIVLGAGEGLYQPPVMQHLSNPMIFN